MLHEVKFPSSNERDQVVGWIYVPACEPEGIVQLVHGFGEHSRRYFHMIVALMDAGFIVAANDHVGHGATAILNDTWSRRGRTTCCSRWAATPTRFRTSTLASSCRKGWTP